MNYSIEDIEGIGPVYAEKLAAADIKTTAQFLNVCRSARGRAETAARTGISEKLILSWSNMADLMRVNGVGSQYAEILHAAGVDTIKELRRRDPKKLLSAMEAVNEANKLAGNCPSLGVVQGWVDSAQDMEPLITH